MRISLPSFNAPLSDAVEKKAVTATARPIVLKTFTSWHICTGGWAVPANGNADWLDDLYETGAVGNYGFYSNTLYDASWAKVCCGNAQAELAQFRFGGSVGTVPIWSQ